MTTLEHYEINEFEEHFSWSEYCVTVMIEEPPRNMNTFILKQYFLGMYVVTVICLKNTVEM